MSPGPGRDRGIVYQQYSLFPFLTAHHNVAIGLMLDQTSLPYRALRVICTRESDRNRYSTSRFAVLRAAYAALPRTAA